MTLRAWRGGGGRVMGIGQHRSQFSSHRCRNKFLQNMAKILSDAEVFEQFSDKKSRQAYRRCREKFVAYNSEFDWSRLPAVESGVGPSAGRGERRGAVHRPWRAAWGRLPAVESGLGPSAGRGERPGAVRRPWRAAWGLPPTVESGLGPSADRGERPGAVRRPWRAAWGLPPTVESDLGPSADRGERPGAVRRPRRAPWGRPPAAESGLGPSVGCGEGINVLKINGNKTMNF